MAKDFNLFILWSNGRHKEKEIIADIGNNFEILQTFEITWSERWFNNNLARFYGKKLPNAMRKKKLCGTGSFLVICVDDAKPKIHEGKNLNIIMAKARYRQMLGSNLIHASDHQTEAEENLLFLTGQSHTDIINGHRSVKPVRLCRDLVGAPSWLDEEQLENFIAKLPGVKLNRSADGYRIETTNVKKTCRLLNARKKLLCLKRNQYQIPVRGKNVCLYLQKSA